MKSIIFSGQCPQCQIADNNVEMRQNNIPFWECPKCELQIIIEKGNAVILRHRGEGNFEYNLLKFKLDCILEETDSHGYPNGIQILDFEHLENYLEKEVQKSKEFSLKKLIVIMLITNLKINQKKITLYNLNILKLILKTNRLKIN
jgi:Zn ribbon nucleic-acid-binding protein